MVEKSLWSEKIERDPAHSKKFIQRFRDLAAAGQDILGEARLVDAMAPREARILDAGCGSGRVGGELARLGHDVIGVDVDPTLIAAAHEDYPGATWLVGDLAVLDWQAPSTIDALGDRASDKFDVAVAAGNVLPFLAPSTRRDVLARLRSSLKIGGRAAVGFGAGRGYEFDDFFTDAQETSWSVDVKLRGWNLLPFEPGSDFLVAIMTPTARGRGRLTGLASAGAPRRFAARPIATPPSSGGTEPADPMGGNRLRPL